MVSVSQERRNSWRYQIGSIGFSTLVVIAVACGLTIFLTVSESARKSISSIVSLVLPGQEKPEPELTEPSSEFSGRIEILLPERTHRGDAQMVVPALPSVLAAVLGKSIQEMQIGAIPGSGTDRAVFLNTSKDEAFCVVYSEGAVSTMGCFPSWPDSSTAAFFASKESGIFPMPWAVMLQFSSKRRQDVQNYIGAMQSLGMAPIAREGQESWWKNDSGRIRAWMRDDETTYAVNLFVTVPEYPKIKASESAWRQLTGGGGVGFSSFLVGDVRKEGRWTISRMIDWSFQDVPMPLTAEQYRYGDMRDPYSWHMRFSLMDKMDVMKSLREEFPEEEWGVSVKENEGILYADIVRRDVADRLSAIVFRYENEANIEKSMREYVEGIRKVLGDFDEPEPAIMQMDILSNDAAPTGG